MTKAKKKKIIAKLSKDADYDDIIDELRGMDDKDETPIVVGEKEYNYICDKFGLRKGELVYHKGIKAFRITSDKHNYSLGENSYDRKTLSTYLKDGEKYDKLLIYMLENYNMKNKPVMHKFCYVANATSSNSDGFVLRKDLEKHKSDFDKWTSIASTLSVAFDIETSSYNCYLPLIKNLKSDNDTIEKYLELTFKKDIKIIKDYMALYAFENRYGISRPVLLLGGDRGTGKNTFLESVMSQIYAGVSSAVTDGDFNTWEDNKLAFLGEISEKHHNTAYLWDQSKKLSGEGTAQINTKHQRQNQITNGLFFVMMSNEPKPLHIKDPIESEENNMLIYVKMRKSDKTDEEIRKLKLYITDQGYNDFKDYFADHLGHYVYTELFEHYKRLRKAIIRRPCRYGMLIPITEDIRELMQLSVSDRDANIMTIVENLYYQSPEGYFLTGDEVSVFNMFASGTIKEDLRGFVPYSILSKLLNKNNVGLSNFKRYIIKRGWLVQAGVRIRPFADYVNKNKTYEGLVLDIVKIEKSIAKSEFETQELIDKLAETTYSESYVNMISNEFPEPSDEKKEPIETIVIKEENSLLPETEDVDLDLDGIDELL